MNPILRTASSLYGTVLTWRRRWYARDPARQRRLARPVVSVGNLRAGGSGKTPLVQSIAQLLLGRGERPAILSRGYGRRAPGDGVMLVSDGAAILADVDHSGDEPLMLARGLPSVPVLVGADRYLSGTLAESRFGVTVHILDDGFQHLALARDVDLLVVDEDDLNEPLLPFGRLREPLASAAVADALLAHVGADRAAHLGEVLHSERVFTVSRTLGRACWLGPRTSEPDPTGEHVLALAGIARPHRFFRDLKAAGWRVAATMAFPDHHWFTGADLRAVADRAHAVGATAVVTTEKDGVRLEGVDRGALRVATVPLTSTIEPAAAFAEWLCERLTGARIAGGRV